MSNPANRLPPEYDEIQPRDYDPQFTADISTKMRIPDRLAALNGGHDEPTDFEQLRHYDIHRTARMHIPDKLILTGQDKSEGFHGPPNLHLESTLFTDMTYMPVSLSTPPRVLKMDEINFPMDEVRYKQMDEDFLQSEDSRSQNGYIQHTPQHYYDGSLRRQALLATPGDHLLISDHEEDDMTILKRQMAKLSYHIVKLEEENSKRSQREIILYPLMFGYLLFQVAKWFLSNK